MKTCIFRARFAGVSLSTPLIVLVSLLLAWPAVAQSPTRTRLLASPGAPGVVSLTAEVDGLGGGAPSGNVAFTANSNAVGSAALSAPGAGQATIAAGDGHSCALTGAGGVECWGDNGYGQLGDATHRERIRSVAVTGLATGVIAIAAGGDHTCAVTSAGGVKCWGSNFDGEAGDGSVCCREKVTPVDVVGLSSGVVAIAAGRYHSCALTSAGGVKCWGWNAFGQLGDGTTTTRFTPVRVSGLSGVVAISAGEYHTCALTRAGAVECWGSNNRGQIGDGTKTLRRAPVDVSGLSGGVVAISAGRSHTCASTSAGAAKCWGDNVDGALGDGTRIVRLSPVDVSGLSGGVVAIAAGGSYWGSHSCALTNAGAVKCWGYNGDGELGDGTTTRRLTPVDVSGLSSGVVAIATGDSHSCALTGAGAAKCWGDNHSGELGDGTGGHSRARPVAVSGLSSGVVAISAGEAHTCALTSAGGAKCWGRNFGEIGDGTTTERGTPVDVSGLSSGVVAISAGSAFIFPSHNCALTGAGGVKCWGGNFNGQLGDGTTTDRLTPVNVFGLSGGVVAISAGSGDTCALTGAGGVKCWGNNVYGQLGDGTKLDRHWPIDVPWLRRGVTAISSGGFHTCALTSAGAVECWGQNLSGQLGDGTSGRRAEKHRPVDVIGLSGGVVAISAGARHSCALTSAGAVKCWGANFFGGLGDGTTIEKPTPVDVSGLPSGVVAIQAGRDYSCALTSAGGVKCWGANGMGQLGDGTTVERHTPVDVAGLSSGVVAIEAGRDHMCALTGAGAAKCWGSSGAGELGFGPLIQVRPVGVTNFLGLARSAARMPAVPLGPGLHTLGARYPGDALHLGSTGQTQITMP